jgi:hypothetical protein
MKPFFHHRLVLAIICALFSFHISLAQQYITEGPLNGTAFSDDNSIGDFPFNIPGNAIASDNARSSASALLTLLNGDTHYLKVTGFGFSIPLYAAITGIRIDVEKSATGINVLATVKDNEIRLLRNNTPVGDNKANNTLWTGTDDYDSYGDTTDAWGTTWSPAQINASDFGVVFSARIAGLLFLLPSARVDHIRITVFYIAPLPVHFLNFTADAKDENEISLEWTTADNDERVMFTVQRSVDGSVWDDLKNIPGVVSYSTKKYQYTDHIASVDKRFFYRIKMTLFSGAALYTRIVLAKTRAQDVFNLFPNPAKNEIFVSCSLNENIELFCINGEKVKVYLEKISTNQVKINTSFLKPGFYVVKVGDKQRQLLIQ